METECEFDISDARPITDADVREFLNLHPRTDEQRAQSEEYQLRLTEQQKAADARGEQVTRLAGVLLEELQRAFATGARTSATIRVRRQADWDDDLVDLVLLSLPIFGCDLHLTRSPLFRRDVRWIRIDACVVDAER